MVERSFLGRPADVAAARRFVVEASGKDVGECYLLELLVSEVVTNTILHAASALVVRVRSIPGAVRVEVFDSSPDPPVLKDLGTDAVTGRGIRLVESAARAWGVDTVADGKWVWFEIDLDDRVPA